VRASLETLDASVSGQVMNLRLEPRTDPEIIDGHTSVTVTKGLASLAPASSTCFATAQHLTEVSVSQAMSG
jgi:hypothetical protein